MLPNWCTSASAGSTPSSSSSTSSSTIVPVKQCKLSRPISHGEYVVVCSYTALDTLAHRPRGTPSTRSMSIFGLCQKTGRLTLLTVTNGLEGFANPAFIRSHPKKDVFYCVTESIKEEGVVVAFGICPFSGQVRELCRSRTFGRSPCYISLSHDLRFLLIVNYWDSTMASIRIDQNGFFLEEQAYTSKIPGAQADVKRQAHGDDPHSKHRLQESHAHAVVFDPSFGRMVYVPDLGEGCIKQFIFEKETGAIKFCGTISCGTGDAGPRYVEFHPILNICYCVNELSSTVIVYRYNEYKALQILESNGELGGKHDATLEKLQEVSTVPSAFPKELNTCGRISVDPTGHWVLCSNRGHDSIAVYGIMMDEHGSGHLGLLEPKGYYHTGGHTPRHFKFSANGKWLFVANQDSDNISVFSFDKGELELRHQYPVQSPNFIETKIACPSRQLNSPWIYSRM